MSNDFTIPEKQKQAFSQLLELPDKARSKMIDALVAAKPALTIKDLAGSINHHVKISHEELVKILRMLGGMYLARVEADVDIAEFADAIIASAKQQALGRHRKGPSVRRRFREDLIRILSAEESLGTTAKALTVVVENERLLCADNTRIVTDIRPIFGQDVKKSPHATVITHLLKVAYHKGSKMKLKEVYFAMDSADIRVMRKLLDRALAKEATLRAQFEKGGFHVLEADLTHEH